MSEENKEMVRQIYEALWKRQAVGFISDHFASDFLGHSVTEIQGPDGLQQWVETLLDALHDGVFTIQDQIAEGDKVVTRWDASGAQVSEFEGLQPAGETITVTGIDLFRIAHGKIIEGWFNVSRPRVSIAMQAVRDERKES